jgi:hypothetical protein
MNRSISHRAALRRLCRICLSATLGAALAAGVAFAEEQPTRRVLLVADKPGDPFVERIKAEIVGLGLGAVIRAPSGPLEENARGQHAIAAIRILPARNGVEVWMADETSGRSLLRQVVIDERPEGPDQNLIALQTAELLRTSLFPRTPAAQSRSTSPVPPAEIATSPVGSGGTVAAPSTAASATATGAQAGLGALLSPGGAGPALQLWLSLHHFFGRRVGLAADFSLPVVRSTLDGPEGTAKIGCAMAGLALLARARSAPTGWFLNGGLGAAVLRLSIEGEARPTLTSSSTSMLTGAAYAHVDGGYAPTHWLRLGAQVMGGAAFDRLHLRFAGNDAGSWGRPFASATLFEEVGW